MVTDEQVKKLMKLKSSGKTLDQSAAQSGMDVKTALRYLRLGKLRTLQRRVKMWRARSGPLREVMFPQRHEPGRLAQSDFTVMDELGVRNPGEPFPHLLFLHAHFFGLRESRAEMPVPRGTAFQTG